jgi:hypothetical protein
MAKCYFELRKQSARGTDSVAADMMRHLHTRQHIGRAVVICDQPAALHAAARKQWLKLSRVIQKQRASTLNADKILKYTHTITHMQHMRFTTKTPLDDPEADIYFLDENNCKIMPLHCYSLYFTAALPEHALANIIEQLPVEALIIDYDRTIHWAAYGLQSKVALEAQVTSEWDKVQQFLVGNHIDVSNFMHNGIHNIEAMDDALDTLLSKSHRFLRIANEFQRALELARPLRIARNDREQYDFVVLLAYRVQALSPGLFTQRFLESYNEDDTFFLYDAAKQLMHTSEPLAEVFQRHLAADRRHLAHALRALYVQPIIRLRTASAAKA